MTKKLSVENSRDYTCLSISNIMRQISGFRTEMLEPFVRGAYITVKRAGTVSVDSKNINIPFYDSSFSENFL